ncbi:MAG: Gfo/Idh/MocA family oxidoreductase [Chloroflexaceae bacterium]|nr:Gfo/Idh/MocA family oxidoreductase [Chloroflexaceae bacterium]
MSKPGVGIIGTGWGARVQAPSFREAGLEIVALAGNQARKTQRIAAELDIPYATGDWKTLLERPNVDLVSIVTPPAFHCEMSIAALEAGKHVLCEKPTALHADEARRMVRAAEARPEQLALIDHELRFLPAVREARRMVVEGNIGHLRHGEVRFVNSSRANLGRVWNWWSDVTQGGGILGAIGSHQIDTVRYLLNDEVSEVQGFLHTFVAERPVLQPETGAPDGTRPVTSDDFASLTLIFSRGGFVNITASMVARKNEPQSITLYGDEGSLRVEDARLWYARPDEAWYEIILPAALR